MLEGARSGGAFAKRLEGFRDQVRSQLPGMRDDRPDFQFDGNASSASAFGEASGVVAEDFVRADVNEKRRKAGEIGVAARAAADEGAMGDQRWLGEEV